MTRGKGSSSKSVVAVSGRGGGSSKGGSSGGSSSTPDTLFSTSVVRIVGLIGEGPIGGVVGGLKGIYRNKVPIQNADNSLNFKGITAEFRDGEPDQQYMAGFPDVESEFPVGTVVTKTIPVVAALSDPGFNRVRVMLFVPSLGISKTDGSRRAYPLNYRIEIRYYNGPWVSQGDFNITGLTQSGYYRQHEFDLPGNPAGAAAPWQIRVSRLSEDDDKANASQDKFSSQSAFQFYSITGIVDSKLTYPHSALVGIQAQTAQLGDSIGDFRALVDGIEMPVPSNRNSSDRSYSGVWDGTFKTEVCDNPAWLLYLLLENDTFGLGEYVDRSIIDKWALYEIGRYCDVMVSDGAGGTEPRFTFNGQVTESQEAYDLLQLVAQAFRGMVYWGSGSVTASQDSPTDYSILATEANVLEEGFRYSSSARKARHTVVIVSWHDPSDFYSENLEYVVDGEGVALYGYNPTKIDLIGCTSRGQAHRAGLWVLLTELYETQVVTYRAGLDHAYVRPGDIVAVQDPQISGLDIGGRLRRGSTVDTLTLDVAPNLVDGVEHQVSVVLPDGRVEIRSVSSEATDSSGHHVLRLANPLSLTPGTGAVWQISGSVVAQKFRVVSVHEVEPNIFEINGLQYEPSKFAAVDDGVPLTPENISQLPNKVEPPKNLVAEATSYIELGLPRQAISLSWLPGSLFNSVAYFVTVVRPSGEILNLPRRADTSVLITDASAGSYTFVVVAVGVTGALSTPATLKYELVGWDGVEGPRVTGLQVSGGGVVFGGRSCSMEWSIAWPANTPVYDTSTVIRVFDPDTNNFLYQELVPGKNWSYDYEVNRNYGGPRRRFQVRASALDLLGRESTPAVVTVSNPAPAAVSFDLTNTTLSAYVDIAPSDDRDLAGYYVCYSTTSGGEFGAEGTTLDLGPSTSVFIPAAQGTTLYVRCAAYDAFSKDFADLNFSAEKSVTIRTGIFDPFPPVIPGTPSLTTAAEVSTDGAVTAVVRATWTASSGDNFGSKYEVGVSEDGGSFVVFGTNGEAFEVHGLRPSIKVQVRVRAMPLNGFAPSDWSPIAEITTAKSTLVPDNPTAVQAVGTYQGVSLTWTPPKARDLAYIEVYSVDGTSLSTSPPSGAVRRQVAAGTASTWDTGVPASGSRTYWLRSVSTSDVVADSYTSPVTTTNPLISGTQLASSIIDATKLATNLKAVETSFTTLPTSGNTEGRQVIVGGKLWVWSSSTTTNGGWSAPGDTASASQISGSITSEQISGLDAAKVAGALSASTIKALNDNRSITGIVASQIASVSPDAFTRKLSDSDIQGISAAKLTTQITRTNIADGSIDTPQLNAGAVSTDKLGAGSVVTSKLAVGGTNTAFNSDYNIGSLGWGASMVNAPSGEQTYVEGVRKDWSPAGMLSFGVRLDRTSTNAVFDVTTTIVAPNGGGSDYPVSPDSTYEFSAYISAHRCQCFMLVVFLDVNKNIISAITGNRIHAQIPGSAPMREWNLIGRSWIIATAPAGAVTAAVRIRCDSTQESVELNNVSYCFVSGLMIAPAYSPTQTEPSPYVRSGITTISGGMLTTESVDARVIRAGSVVVGKLDVANIFADSAVINAIRTNSIDTNTITARLLNAQYIYGRNIFAGEITASKLTLSDASNMVLNGDFLNGTSEGWILNGDSIIDAPGPADPGGAWRCTGTTATTLAFSQWVQVTPGDELYATCMMYCEDSRPGNAGIYLEFADQNGGSSSTTFTAFRSDKNTWVRIEGRSVVPSGKQKVRLCLFADNAGQGRAYFGKIQMRRAASAQLIVDGAITAAKVNVDDLFANNAVLNKITAGVLTAGAIKTDMLSAGAVSVDKIGVGLSTGNLLWNSENSIEGWWSSYDGYTPEWGIPGTRAVYIRTSSPPASGERDMDMLFPASEGSTSRVSVVGGQQYELSVYLSTHRCIGRVEIHFHNGSNYYVGLVGNEINNYQYKGPPNDTWRSKVMVTAPADATSALIRVKMVYNGGSDCYVFASGLYLATTARGATGFSPYTPQSQTILTGGVISTNSLNANRIIAGTITTDRLAAGQIDVSVLNAESLRARIVNTDGLQASSVVVGSTRLNSWVSGSDSTKINAGALEANSIRANQMKIGARGIQLVGISFYAERDGNGNLNNVIGWTAGSVLIINDSGDPQAFSIPATRVGINGNYWYIWWNKISPDNFGCGQDNWDNIYRDTNTILIATVSNLTGIAVLVGGTIIDGTRITTRSIQADQIAANAIQAIHVSANSITADKIGAGAVTADKISAGTLNAGDIYVGSDRFRIESQGQRIRIYGQNGSEAVCIGNVSPWTGGNAGGGEDYGIILRDYNSNEIVKITQRQVFLHGAYILGASIGSAAIQDAAINNAKIGNLQVDTIKIANSAVSQIVASSNSGHYSDVGITIRTGEAKVNIYALNINNPNPSRSLQVLGIMQIYWYPGGNGNDGRLIKQCACNFWVDSDKGQHHCTTPLGVTHQPGPGYHIYAVRTNTAVGEESYISVTELTK